MYTGNREEKAHRVFYENCVGPVPDGMYLQHKLPKERRIGHACCNPEHLQISNSPRLEPEPTPQSLHYKVCPKGHLITPDNIVTEQRKGSPKARCRSCRQESWRKHSARRSAKGFHT